MKQRSLFLLLLTTLLNASPAWINLVKKGDLSKVKKTITQGVDIDYRDSSGKTALIWSILTEHHDIYNLLLNYGADPSLKDRLGLKVFDYIIEKVKFYQTELMQNEKLIQYNIKQLKLNRNHIRQLLPSIKKQNEALNALFDEMTLLTNSLEENDQALILLKEQINTLEKQMTQNKVTIEKQMVKLRQELSEMTIQRSSHE